MASLNFRVDPCESSEHNVANITFQEYKTVISPSQEKENVISPFQEIENVENFPCYHFLNPMSI